MPDIISLKTKEHTEYKPLIGKKWLASQECASDLIKSLAVIGGQWPHTSYMLPGGVMSDPSLFDISIIEGYLKQTIRFVEDNLLGVSLETYLSFNKIDELSLLNKDLKEFYDISNDNKLYNFGKSYNRFISLSSNHTYNKGRINKKHISNIDLTKIHENSDFTFDINKKSSKDGKYGWAKAVNYMNDYYETGPLARAMINKNELITSIHGEYQDSIPTRVFARIDELIRLLHSSLEIVKKIDVSEASYIKPIQNINTVEKVSASGTCEAARGSLVHEVSIKKGIISKYNVITPTVWNLGPGSKKRPGVAQKALIGSSSSKIAEIILRSFDVCSVCTTH